MIQHKKTMGLCVVIAALVVLVALAPSLASSRWVYASLLRQLAAGDFAVDVDTVSLSWFSPLKLRGVVIRELEDPSPLLSVEEISTDQGLLSYLIRGVRATKIVLDSPKIDIEWMGNDTNVRRLVSAIEGRLGKSQENNVNDKDSSKTPLQVQIVVKNLQVQVQPQLNKNLRKESTEVVGKEPLVVVANVNLDGTYNRNSEGAFFHLEPTQFLTRTELTPELMRLGLGYAIPVLAKSAWFQGSVSLQSGAIDIPINNPLQSTGTAEITLHQVKSGPTEPEMMRLLDILARIRGQESSYELVFIEGSKIEIQVANQKVTHRGLQLGLPKIDSRLQIATSGSVELGTRALDLLVDVPVPLEQLAIRGKVRQLGVPTIGVAVRGTLDKPEVDWSAMRGESADLIGLIRGQIDQDAPGTSAALGALEGLADGQADKAIGAAVDLFKEIRKRRQEQKSSEAAGDNKPTDSQPSDSKPPERPVLDALKNIFRRGP